MYACQSFLSQIKGYNYEIKHTHLLSYIINIIINISIASYVFLFERDLMFN